LRENEEYKTSKTKPIFKPFKVTKFFTKMNNQLLKIKELFKEIRIKPVRGPEHNFWSFYFGLTDFERTEFDC